MFLTEVPGCPELIEMTNLEKTSATLRWKKPKYDGGSPLTAFIIERREEFKDTWVKEKQVDTYVHSLQVKDLVPENKYYFRVSAKNNIGVGEPIELQEPIVPSKPVGKLYISMLLVNSQQQ